MGRSKPAEGQEWDTGTKAQRPFVQLLYQKRKMNPYELSSKPPDWYHGVDITWFYFLAGRASPALGENQRPLSLLYLAAGRRSPPYKEGSTVFIRESFFSVFSPRISTMVISFLPDEHIRQSALSWLHNNYLIHWSLVNVKVPRTTFAFQAAAIAIVVLGNCLSLYRSLASLISPRFILRFLFTEPGQRIYLTMYMS